MEILRAQFPIGIPVHSRRQEGGLVLIHLWLFPGIQDGEGCLLLDVDRSTLRGRFCKVLTPRCRLNSLLNQNR